LSLMCPRAPSTPAGLCAIFHKVGSASAVVAQFPLGLICFDAANMPSAEDQSIVDDPPGCLLVVEPNGE
jgi:hypothetical protein